MGKCSNRRRNFRRSLVKIDVDTSTSICYHREDLRKGGGVMTERFETFVLSINQIYRCIQKIKSREMVELGLKGTHVMCLFQLGQHPEGLTAAELAQRSLEA